MDDESNETSGNDDLMAEWRFISGSLRSMEPVSHSSSSNASKAASKNNHNHDGSGNLEGELGAYECFFLLIISWELFWSSSMFILTFCSLSSTCATTMEVARHLMVNEYFHFGWPTMK